MSSQEKGVFQGDGIRVVQDGLENSRRSRSSQALVAGDGGLGDAPRSGAERVQLGAMAPPSCGSPFAQQIPRLTCSSSARGSALDKPMGARPV